MNNTIEIQYARTGVATNTDALGMREMQAMVYAQRHRRHLLVKAPPASGKSRAMMFVALDKLANQGVRKVIVSVPQQNIGRSFKNTRLSEYGFFADWTVAPAYDLCIDSTGEDSKKERLRDFLGHPTARIAVCTHATMLNALADIDAGKMDDVFFGIDEFHHGSADEYNQLGTFIRRLLNDTSAHILAMTGSYFRGDAVPVMRPEDEARFSPAVTYTYYQQLNGYTWLKSLGLGYAFFQGHYLSAIPETLDTRKKTLIHIPHPRSKTSGRMDKHDQVAEIIKCIGEIEEINHDYFYYKVRTPDGRLLTVADLVEDNPERRGALQAYLRSMNSRDALDILIALGTAKEGFDWEWCEHCITVGVRESLTEVVQIIGRCTRDCEGKTHAQFTNLIPHPLAETEDVAMAVNDFLKAISAALLMEQVLAPRWTFRTRPLEEAPAPAAVPTGQHSIVVHGLPELTARTQAIAENDLDTLLASALQDSRIREAIINQLPADFINNVLWPKIIREKYPDLDDEEIDTLAAHTTLSLATQGEQTATDDSGNKLIGMAGRFVNINDIDINLIRSINPFQRAYEVVSKSLTPETLRSIQYALVERSIGRMEPEEALYLFEHHLGPWREQHPGKLRPELSDPDPFARRLAVAAEKVIQLWKEELSK